MKRAPKKIPFWCLSLVAIELSICCRPAANTNQPPKPKATPTPQARPKVKRETKASPKTINPPAPQQLERDGNDSAADVQGLLPSRGRFEKIGRHFASLQRICDLTPHGGKLYASHATRPLMFSGATITRYDPAKKAFQLAFDWNRPGQPPKGGNAGQGFLRIRSISEHLYVPDADPPYLGLGLTRYGIEGYVFRSSAGGSFLTTRQPGQRPPPLVQNGGAGTYVLPGALHVFDVIRFRNKLYASTSSAPKNWQKSNASPAALHVEGPDSQWHVAETYPSPPRAGTWRFRFLVRFRDRLFAAVTDFRGRDKTEYVVFNPSRQEEGLGRGLAFRVTEQGGALTLRWFADQGKLYWLVIGGLLVSEDGQSWKQLKLPNEAGQPTDIARLGSAIVILAEGGLYQLKPEGVSSIAPIKGKKSPFRFRDSTCTAPLAVLHGALYAGGQRQGALYKLVAAGETSSAP